MNTDPQYFYWRSAEHRCGKQGRGEPQSRTACPSDYWPGSEGPAGLRRPDVQMVFRNRHGRFLQRCQGPVSVEPGRSYETVNSIAGDRLEERAAMLDPVRRLCS